MCLHHNYIGNRALFIALSGSIISSWEVQQYFSNKVPSTVDLHWDFNGSFCLIYLQLFVHWQFELA